MLRLVDTIGAKTDNNNEDDIYSFFDPRDLEADNKEEERDERLRRN